MRSQLGDPVSVTSSLADITTTREGAYRPRGSGDDGFGEQ